MPSKLKLKPSQQDIETILKRERRERKKRRKEEARHRTNDDLTPPRNPPRHPHASTSYLPADDLGFDESSVPPEQARKRVIEEEEERDEAEKERARGRRFYDRLQDEMEADLGVGYYEDLLYEREAAKIAASFSYGGAAGIAMGLNGGAGVRTGLEAMDEEEYAEHVRAGMWRRKNKDEAERLERVQKMKEEKEKKEREELEGLRKKERERIRKLEEGARKRNKKEEEEARKRYEDKWKKLMLPVLTPTPAPTPPPAPSTTNDLPTPLGPSLPPPPPPGSLRFTDFPWPIHPPAPLPPLSWPSTADLNPSAISRFLVAHLPDSDSKEEKKVLRTAVLAYHPDRFERLVGRIPEDKAEVRERVRELGLRVSQVLNELLKGL